MAVWLVDYVFYFFVIFYVYSNTKLPLRWHDNNKKYHCENTKKPFDTSFNIVAFKGILVISLCFLNVKRLICLWSIW
jgi:hypothetical protein